MRLSKQPVSETNTMNSNIKETDTNKEKSTNETIMFSIDTIQSSTDVGKECGYRAIILYRALLGSYTIQKTESFKLINKMKIIINLSNSQLSQDTKKLEKNGFINVERKPGHKNLFTLTKKGKAGLVKTTKRSNTAKQ